MSPALPLLVLLQAASVRVGGEQSSQDTLRREARRDSIRREAALRASDNSRRPVRRIPVTAEHLRTAFRDSAARTLLLRAREARLQQDSTLTSYDASAHQRISVGLGFRATGRNRLLFRTESASRVRWSRTNGLHVDIKGRRTALPVADDEGEVNIDDMGPVPYFPGREALWVGSGVARAEVDENEMVHPIATGSEAYYIYEAGDSLTITLSDGKAIRLRELQVVPRRPEWKFSVGSFWFDQESGQLVRAVYRFAATMNIWAVADEEIEREQREREERGEPRKPDEEVPGWVKGFMSPMEANLEALTVEYGLFGGRYWLPRTQYAEGYGRASFMRVPFKVEESFRYASVNGTDSLPPQARELSMRELRDSLFGDSTRFRDLPDSVRQYRSKVFAQVDSARRAARVARRKEECAATGSYTRTESRNDGSLRATVRIPCDTQALVNSPEFTGSIYEPGEELFGVTERNELLKALDFSLQPVWAPMPVRVDHGLDLWRYNRVEGLSAAARATQQLGKGYSWDAMGRLGTADLSVYGELGVARSNGRHRWRVGGYRRLVASNGDWGSPLSFGASFGALFYGRDEGYYHRASGVELERSLLRGGGVQLRTFAELQHAATWNTEFNISRALGSNAAFQPNIRAERALVAGVALRQQFGLGQDPTGTRLMGDWRLEGGALLDRALDTASAGYGRLAADLTVTRPIAGKLAGALTLGAGHARGAPLQRQFFLGGAQTVRGQLLGSAAGDTYWLGRAELGRTSAAFRPVIFGDIGWAGAWESRNTPGRPLSGAGVGASILDGLIRMDLSRGIYPRQKMRFDLYVEARF